MNDYYLNFAKEQRQNIIQNTEVILSVLLKDVAKLNKLFKTYKDDSNKTEIQCTIYLMHDSLWDLKHEIEKL